MQVAWLHCVWHVPHCVWHVPHVTAVASWLSLVGRQRALSVHRNPVPHWHVPPQVPAQVGPHVKKHVFPTCVGHVNVAIVPVSWQPKPLVSKQPGWPNVCAPPGPRPGCATAPSRTSRSNSSTGRARCVRVKSIDASRRSTTRVACSPTNGGWSAGTSEIETTSSVRNSA